MTKNIENVNNNHEIVLNAHKLYALALTVILYCGILNALNIYNDIALLWWF